MELNKIKLDELNKIKIDLENEINNYQNKINNIYLKSNLKEILKQNISPQVIQFLPYKNDFKKLPNLSSKNKIMAKDWNIWLDNIYYLNEKILECFRIWMKTIELISIIKTQWLRQFNTIKY